MTSFWRMICAEAMAIAAIYTLAFAHQSWRQFASIRVPTTDKLLRPPGESLSRKLTGLDEKISLCVALLVGGPVFLAFQTQMLPLTSFLWLALAVIALCCAPLWIAAKTRRDYALGYRGERVVGEMLNQLLRDGCHVFHDYPGGPNWNIDHVIVTPSGVYAVETKTRRKRDSAKDKRAHEVIFDGERLIFPKSYDVRALEQARRNAKDLSSELSAATAEPVNVKAILTFPGWLVTRKGKSDVKVLNPKEIRSAILGDSEPRLSSAQLQRIVHQLEQKCRDVEF